MVGEGRGKVLLDIETDLYIFETLGKIEGLFVAFEIFVMPAYFGAFYEVSFPDDENCILMIIG